MKDIINNKSIIENTRKRFVIWTMVILLIVTILSISFRATILYSDNTNETKNILDLIQSQDKIEKVDNIINPLPNNFEERISTSKALIVKFKSTIVGDNIICQITEYKCGDIFTEDEIKDYLNKSLSNMYSTKSLEGRTNNLFYRFNTLEYGENTMYSVERSEELKDIGKTILIFSIFLICLMAVLSIVLIFVSKQIVKPVKQIFDAQREFVSNASHELKTPMSIISANADVISDDGRNTEWVQNIKEQVGRMNNLIEDMLTLAKIDEGHIQKEIKNFDISKALSTVTLPFEALAFEKHKSMDFDIEPQLFIVGYEKDYKDIITILIDNAIKYASENGNIKVLLQRDGKFTKTTIWNTGCDIEEKDKERIFERFYRTDKSHTSQTGGSGLGLSIAKALADNNGWKLDIEVKKGVYTQFSLII